MTNINRLVPHTETISSVIELTHHGIYSRDCDYSIAMQYNQQPLPLLLVHEKYYILLCAYF